MFTNRREAGRLLGDLVAMQLPATENPEVDQLVIGVGRGGILVAGSVAVRLNSPLSAVSAETIADAENSATAVGAVSSCGFVVYDDRLKCQLGEQSYLGYRVRELSKQARETQHRWLTTAGLQSRPRYSRKRVIVISDGLISELAVQAAAMCARQAGASQIVLATPVIVRRVREKLDKSFDNVFCLAMALETNVVDVYEQSEDLGDQDIIQTLIQSDLSRNQTVCA